MSKNTAFRVSNESSQSERRAILRNERAVGTYHAFATSEADAIGGRFAARERSTVIGAGQVAYPTLPPNSPWASDPVPAEEPLGVDINAVEAVGTHAEIEHSLREVRDGTGQTPTELPLDASPNDGGRAPLGGVLPTNASRRSRHLSKQKG
jgi:hypothetical protein